MFLSNLCLGVTFCAGCIELVLIFFHVIENSAKTSLLFLCIPVFCHVSGTWGDFASIGLFVQRTIMVLKPIHSPVVHKAITFLIIVISSTVSAVLFYGNFSTYKNVEIPFGEGCYAFYCLASLGIAERTTNFYVRVIGSMFVVISGSVFVIVFRKKRSVHKQSSESKFGNFVQYTFVVRTIVIMGCIIPDLIMVKTVGKRLSDFIGPYLMFFTSFSSLLTVVVYFSVVMRRQIKVVRVNVTSA
uniref:G_PROTEIN_RECEP_F1_2 domain-containing protein n=1 Tax=Steinernema glaseri TaxID=37863 RepID=A0A1I7Z5Z0_9BILA